MAGRCCVENNELTCAMLRGVDHARPWWPDSTMQLQRREFGKRLQHMGGTGPQTGPQIHPPPPYSARPPSMHQRTHRLHMQAPRRCSHPSPVWLYVDLRKASTHPGFLNPKDRNNPGPVAAAHKGDSDCPTPHDRVTRKHRCVAKRVQRKRACRCEGGSQPGTHQTLRPNLSPKATMP